MRFSKFCSDPNYRPRIEFGSVSENLPDMYVISLIKLVFDEDIVFAVYDLADNISGKAVYRVLCSYKHKSGEI